MAASTTAQDYLEAARSEDLKSQEIQTLSVVTNFERQILESLKAPGAHLLQGARGVGKTTLLRYAETELDVAFSSSKILGVYVNFKASTLLEGISAGQRSAFQIWINTKVLQAVHEKLVALGLLQASGVGDPYEAVFGISSVEKTGTFLQEKLHQIQKLAFAADRKATEQELGEQFLDRLYDASFLSTVLKEVISRYHLSRLVLFFDEAAHTFIPAQQEIFFEIFKFLHGGHISCKAAVYPTVTSYGRNFEVGHDAIVLALDRYEPAGPGRRLFRTQFREIVDKRLPKQSRKRKEVFQHGELLDQVIDISTGNPRAFLHVLNATLGKGFSERAIALSAQEYVDNELLPYHQNLAKRLPKYSAHVRVGLDLLRHYLIPEIRKKNRQETKSQYQAAAFTIPRDISANMRLAPDILCYSGSLLSKGTVKIANQKTGQRYVVNVALLLSERAFGSTKLKTNLDSISLTDYREFSSSDSQIASYLNEIGSTADTCSSCSAQLIPNAKFCSSCGAPVQATSSVIAGLLDEPITALSISVRMKDRIKDRFSTVGDVVQATRDDLMQIPYIKEVRSRIIKNAADEFISG